MSKRVEFFRCFSINLHNFLKASGLRYMNKGVHDTGIDLSKDNGETWMSFSSIYQPELREEVGEMTPKEIDEVRLRLLETRDPITEVHGDMTFKKRIRFYWVYEITPELEEALEIWDKTGPNGN